MPSCPVLVANLLCDTDWAEVITRSRGRDCTTKSPAHTASFAHGDLLLLFILAYVPHSVSRMRTQTQQNTAGSGSFYVLLATTFL
jgi:hypothetical protein